MGDYDNDGDLDIFSASSKGNVLFINTGETFSAVSPVSVGLPGKSFTANWVDFQNDGLMDLHTVPGGLYVQKQKGEFIFSSQLKITQGRFSPFRLTGARAAWFDIDNNGSRDLLLSTKYAVKNTKWANWFAKMTGSDGRFGGLRYFWKAVSFNNKNTDSHWLQVQLIGPPSNRQAIGAIVTVVMPEGLQTQQVGGSEGSHYSQGHYRLYFGLGAHPKPLKINVTWSDGQSTEIIDPAGDRLLKIQRRKEK
jgi:hypothetical protein